MESKKSKIVDLFMEHVKGNMPEPNAGNQRHDGRDGHWLEKQMGIVHNASNAPDLFGYEMKNETRSKTTFGDWSADYYVFRDSAKNLTRDEFLQTFGKPNPLRGNRYSWSGEPIPTANRSSSYNGSEMVFGHNGAAISIIYNYSKDPRENKENIVPRHLQQEGLVLASWSRDNLKAKFNAKFSQNGWFRCMKDHSGHYNRIEFGAPMDFEKWLSLIEEGVVFFDSGMYEGNSRNYSQWRANNDYWDSLIVDSYS